MIKAYAEPKGHFVEVKLTNEELSDPLLVFSEIYTYAAKDPTLLNIDQSIKGKAVVFVSSDTLLKPEDLIK